MSPLALAFLALLTGCAALLPVAVVEWLGGGDVAETPRCPRWMTLPMDTQ